MTKYFFIIVLFLITTTIQFTPSTNLEFLAELIDKDLNDKTNFASETLTHVDILKKGFFRSLDKYLNEINSVNYEIDFKPVLDLMSKSIVSVDLDTDLKDLPWAHFDANMILQSNLYVNQLINSIYKDILINRDFFNARINIGKVLHTIQDFYSHTNWVEMGYEDKINKNLGMDSNDFGVEISDGKEENCLNQNCTKHVIQCKYLKALTYLVPKFVFKFPFECPIVYFKCKNNVIKNKLTSGYFTGQKLPNGEEIKKPFNSSKCSHGGFMDKTSFEYSYGGINKDTGFFFLSPHADLHLKAANLAIEHTEYFFDLLRDKIGNINFNELFFINFEKGNV